MTEENRKCILKILIQSKKLYVNNYSSFMCFCIKKAIVDSNNFIGELENKISYHIPEFNYLNLNGTLGFDSESSGWWPTFDKKSRLLAFDKLISTYQ